MSHAARLKALQKRCSQPVDGLTHEERLRRVRERAGQLLAYEGDDPASLDRKARLIALLRKWRKEGRI